MGFCRALGIDSMRALLGARDKTASPVRIHTRVFVACTAAGIILSLCVSLIVRPHRDKPTGAGRTPFSHLLGSNPPPFQLPSLETGTMGWSGELVGDATVLYFTDSECPACDEVYPYLKEASSRIRLLIVGVGNRDALKQKLASHGISTQAAGYDSVGRVRAMYGVRMVPSALLINAQGKIERGGQGTLSLAQIGVVQSRAHIP